MDGNLNRELEEKLRETASIGDMESLANLLNVKNVDVNSRNKMNGRTALHWGAKRNLPSVVQYLLAHGADKEAVDRDGKTPGELTTSPEVHILLGGTGEVAEADPLPITPNYLTNPPFPYASSSQSTSNQGALDTGGISQPVNMMTTNHSSASSGDELVLKIRIAYLDDPDFIETELPRVHLRYDTLLNMMCAELGVDKQLVSRIRKLPNTILRKDKDVTRLQDFQELELVLTNKARSASSRSYIGIQSNPNMTKEQILY